MHAAARDDYAAKENEHAANGDRARQFDARENNIRKEGDEEWVT